MFYVKQQKFKSLKLKNKLEKYFISTQFVKMNQKHYHYLIFTVSNIWNTNTPQFLEHPYSTSE